MTIDKAIILSAGQGSRLLPLTRDIPKCLIEFNGRSLISWQVAALVANGIKDIVVVTGLPVDRTLDEIVAELNGLGPEPATGEAASFTPSTARPVG